MWRQRVRGITLGAYYHKYQRSMIAPATRRLHGQYAPHSDAARIAGDHQAPPQPPSNSMDLRGNVSQQHNKKYTSLQMAAMNGSIGAVKTISALQPSAAQQLTDDGETPIYLAAAHGHAEVVRLLADQWPAGVSQPVGSSTPLLVATEKGHAEVVSVLTLALSVAAHGADTPSLLHSAAEGGHLDMIAMLAQQCPDAVSHRFRKSTPLHVAVERGDVAAVRALLGVRPIAVRDANGDGAAPVYLAVEHGHAEVVELLVSLWPEGALQAVDGLNALQVACKRGHASTVEALLKGCPGVAVVPRDAKRETHDEDTTPVYLAAAAGHAEIVSMLLRHSPQGAWTPVPYDSRMSKSHPLEVAVQQGNAAIVKLLLEVLPEPGSWCYDKEIIRKAISSQNVDVVTMLLRRWPAYGDNALYDAIRSGQYAVVKAILENSSKKSIHDMKDHLVEPLHDAARQGHAEVVALVAEYCPASVSTPFSLDSRRNHFGNMTTSTALQTAACNGRTTTVKALFDAFPPTKDWSAEVTSVILVAAAPKGADDALLRLLLPRANRDTQLEALLYAAIRGDLPTVRSVLEVYPDAATKTIQGFRPQSAIHEAAGRGHTEMLTVLLATGPEVIDVLGKRFGYWESTPLHAAIEGGHTDAVECILNACPATAQQLGKNDFYANVNHFNATPIYLAASKGHSAIVELLLRRWPEGALQRVGTSTPLLAAILGGHLTTVTALLDAHPAAIREQSPDGETCIYVAARCGYAAIVELLLHRWPEGALQRVGTLTPLLAAIGRGSSACVKHLLAAHPATALELSPEGVTPIYLASRFGNVEIIESLVRLWPEGARHRVDNMTPLHAAIVSLHAATAVGALLAACPDAAVDLTAEGLTPIQLAVKHGSCAPVLELLGRCWPDGLVQRVDGMTPLLLAVQLNRTEAAQALLRVRPTSACDTTLDGRTAVYIAAALGHAEMIEVLAPHWPEGVSHRCDGATPLHAAIEKGHTEAVKALLRIRPAVSEDATAAGEAPILLAARLDLPEVITALAGVDPQIIMQRCSPRTSTATDRSSHHSE